jgi:hypothetical protein
MNQRLDPTALVSLSVFIDHEGLRRSLARLKLPLPPATDLARGLVRFASELGDLAACRAYDDWTAHQADPYAFRGQQVEPILVLPVGNAAALVAMTAAAMAHASSPHGSHVYVLVSGEPAVSQLARALRDRGRSVIVIGPAALTDSGIAAGATRFVRLEDVLGAGPAAAAPSEWTGDDFDWRRFVTLVAWLELRLPFVGVGYLIKKAMTYENVGTSDPRIKQAIFQKAQERGLVEVYYKENIDEDADPVAACRLIRTQPLVAEVLREEELEDPGE